MIDLCGQRCPALGVSRGRRHRRLVPPPQRPVQRCGSPPSPLMRRPRLFAPSDPDISCPWTEGWSPPVLHVDTRHSERVDVRFSPTSAKAGGKDWRAVFYFFFK